MKINLHILLLGILLVSALYSCNNEDDLDISEKKDNRFDLPQGDHDFDDQIVEWNNNYGTSVLYRFSNADLNYHFTSSSNDVVYDVKVEAEEEGIRAAVQFLKEDFFDLYSDEVKKELFPAKILMAGMLYQNNNYVPLWDKQLDIRRIVDYIDILVAKLADNTMNTSTGWPRASKRRKR